MNNSNDTNNTLKSYKIKLALIFTTILVLTIMLFQSIYAGIGVYNNRKINQDFINRATQRIKSNIGRGNQFGMGIGRNMMMGIPGNMDDHEKKDFSPRLEYAIFSQEDGKIYSSTMQLLMEQGALEKDFVFSGTTNDELQETNNGDDYYFIYKTSIEKDGKSYTVYLLINDLLPTSKVVNDLLLFFLFAIFLGGVLYFFVYTLINRNLKKVEIAMNDMENFIHNAGHELKTPLTVASSSLQLALIDKSTDEYITQARESIKKMDLLIESLLELSTLQRNVTDEDVDVSKCIDEALEYFKADIKKKNITIIKSLQERTLKTKKEHLYILISNIIKNAIKYNKEGGDIEITLNKNRLEIKDTGQGIPKNEINRIFERFYQVGEARNQEGYGIGLSLVKKLCDMYGRNISVKSHEGEGTTFYITF